jgi:hypothetical protein
MKWAQKLNRSLAYYSILDKNNHLLLPWDSFIKIYYLGLWMASFSF